MWRSDSLLLIAFIVVFSIATFLAVRSTNRSGPRNRRRAELDFDGTNTTYFDSSSVLHSSVFHSVNHSGTHDHCASPAGTSEHCSDHGVCDYDGGCDGGSDGGSFD